MKTLSFVFTLLQLAGLINALANESLISFGGLAGSNHFRTQASFDQISSTPKWQILDGEPPLPIGKAISISAEHLNKYQNKDLTFILESSSLQRFPGTKDIFYYLITWTSPIAYLPSEPFPKSNENLLRFAVFMDGSIFSPTLID